MSKTKDRKENLALAAKIVKEESASLFADALGLIKRFADKARVSLLTFKESISNKLFFLRSLANKRKATPPDQPEESTTALEGKTKEKVWPQVKSQIQQFSFSKKQIAIGLSATICTFGAIFFILALESNEQQETGVVIEQPNTFTAEGPKGFAIGPFYLGMEINSALELLNSSFKEQLLDNEGIPGKPNYRKAEIEESGRRKQIINGFLEIRTGAKDLVRSINFSGNAMDVLISTPYESVTEFAQAFINEKRIPEMNVERQDERFWWYFESSHGYRVEINQQTKGVRFYMTN